MFSARFTFSWHQKSKLDRIYMKAALTHWLSTPIKYDVILAQLKFWMAGPPNISLEDAGSLLQHSGMMLPTNSFPRICPMTFPHWNFRGTQSLQLGLSGVKITWWNIREGRNSNSQFQRLSLEHCQVKASPKVSLQQGELPCVFTEWNFA